MSEIWYEEISSNSPISQGDIFPQLHIYSVVPSSVTNFDPEPDVEHFESAAIILTQACDLENDPPAESVVVATLWPVRGKSWNFVSNVLKGHTPALHILNEYTSESVNFEFHYIDFSDLYTIPYSVLNQARESLPIRLRLTSPYVEHASQRFGSYFSRIGLPKGIVEDRIKQFVRENRSELTSNGP